MFIELGVAFDRFQVFVIRIQVWTDLAVTIKALLVILFFTSVFRRSVQVAFQCMRAPTLGAP